jgi:hypothetical protein
MGKKFLPTRDMRGLCWPLPFLHTSSPTALPTCLDYLCFLSVWSDIFDFAPIHDDLTRELIAAEDFNTGRGPVSWIGYANSILYAGRH